MQQVYESISFLYPLHAQYRGVINTAVFNSLNNRVCRSSTLDLKVKITFLNKQVTIVAELSAHIDCVQQFPGCASYSQVFNTAIFAILA